MALNHRRVTTIDTEAVLKHIREVKPEVEFEALFPGRTEELAAGISWLYSTLRRLMDEADGLKLSDPQVYSAMVSWKATTNLMAALELFRRGYATEAVGQLRNSIEILAMVVHLAKEPELFKKVASGDFDAKKSIGPAKQWLPELGKVNGLLCFYAHATPLSIFPGHSEGADGEELVLLVGGGFQKSRRKLHAFLFHQIEFCLQLLRMAIEAVFYQHISDLRFWKLQDGSLIKELAEEEKALVERRIAEMDEVIKFYKVKES